MDLRPGGHVRTRTPLILSLTKVRVTGCLITHIVPVVCVIKHGGMEKVCNRLDALLLLRTYPPFGYPGASPTARVSSTKETWRSSCHARRSLPRKSLENWRRARTSRPLSLTLCDPLAPGRRRTAQVTMAKRSDIARDDTHTDTVLLNNGLQRPPGTP